LILNVKPAADLYVSPELYNSAIFLLFSSYVIKYDPLSITKKSPATPKRSNPEAYSSEIFFSLSSKHDNNYP
jgi:hypothetical protein